jgi:hypothetical protein
MGLENHDRKRPADTPADLSRTMYASARAALAGMIGSTGAGSFGQARQVTWAATERSSESEDMGLFVLVYTHIFVQYDRFTPF